MKKTMKGLICLLLVLTILATTFPVSSFAVASPFKNSKASVNQSDNGTTIGYDQTQDKITEYYEEITDQGSNRVDVYVTQESSFSVKIPKKVILNGKLGETNSGSYEVEVQGNLASEDIVFVNPVEDLYMTSTGKTAIPTEVSQDKTSFRYADGVRIENSVKTQGTVTANGMTAGEWHGGFELEINMASYSTRELVEYFTWGADPDVATSVSAGTLDTDYPDLVKTNASSNSTYSYPDKTMITGLTEAGINWIRTNGGNLVIPSCASSIRDGDGANNLNGAFSISNPDYGTRIEDRIVNTVIADSVLRIGKSAFAGQHNMKSVSFNNVESIDSFAFFDTGLTAINLNNAVSSLGNGAFRACVDLKKAFGFENVTVIPNYLFCDDRYLTGVDGLDHIATVSTGAFANCYSLESVDFTDSLSAINGSETFTYTKIPMSYWNGLDATIAQNAVFPENYKRSYNYTVGEASETIVQGFGQKDARWKNTKIAAKCSNGVTFGNSGCSYMVSTAAINTLTNSSYTPVTFAKYLEDNYPAVISTNGAMAFFGTDGNTYSGTQSAFNNFGVSIEAIKLGTNNDNYSNIQRVVDALCSGKLVYLGFKQSNNRGHAVLLHGIEKDGNVKWISSDCQYYTMSPSGLVLTQKTECIYHSCPIENLIQNSDAVIFTKI